MADFDLIVVGAGSGGVRAARIAAAHGAKVAIAEEYRVGEIYLAANSTNDAQVLANAQKIIAAIQQGGSFVGYARQFSEASTAAVGRRRAPKTALPAYTTPRYMRSLCRGFHPMLRSFFRPSAAAGGTRSCPLRTLCTPVGRTYAAGSEGFPVVAAAEPGWKAGQDGQAVMPSGSGAR